MHLVLKVVNAETLPDECDDVVVIEGPETFRIGRSGAVNWQLPDETRSVSANHCEIKCHRGNIFELHDLSTNGTFLEGSNSRLSSPHYILENDRFKIGPYIVQANFAREDELQKYASTRDFWISLAVGSRDENGGRLTSLVFSKKKKITIGRASDSDIRIDDGTRRISRLHCEIIFDEGRFAVVDRSKNGLMLNKHLLNPSEMKYLAVNDQIKISTGIIIVADIKDFIGNNAKPSEHDHVELQAESSSDSSEHRASSKRGRDPAESGASDSTQRRARASENERRSRASPNAAALEDEADMTRIVSRFKRPD